MKRVLVTGGTGLIGKYCLELLRELDFSVYAVTRGERHDSVAVWKRTDLLERGSLKALFAEIRPEYLLHLAWDTRPGAYLESNSNFSWLVVSLEMLRFFHEYGGRRAVFAGTCFEYEFTHAPLIENGARKPMSTYAKCKDHLNSLAALFCSKNGISYAWGRIFYVYGSGEQQGRLTPAVIDAALSGTPFTIRGGALRRDYMYAKDIAAAFAKLLTSGVEGEVNICSGLGVVIADYCRLLAGKMDGCEALRFENASGEGQPPAIIGDNRRLRDEVGFVPSYDLDKGFEDMLLTMGVQGRGRGE